MIQTFQYLEVAVAARNNLLCIFISVQTGIMDSNAIRETSGALHQALIAQVTSSARRLLASGLEGFKVSM